MGLGGQLVWATQSDVSVGLQRVIRVHVGNFAKNLALLRKIFADCHVSQSEVVRHIGLPAVGAHEIGTRAARWEAAARAARLWVHRASRRKGRIRLNERQAV